MCFGRHSSMDTPPMSILPGDPMSKSLPVTLAAAALLALLSASDTSACTQGGQCPASSGGCFLTQYLYNDDFSEGCAWNVSSGTSVTTSGGTQMCSIFPSYLTLGYNGGGGGGGGRGV